MLGGLLSSIVNSTLMKSMWTSSNGACTLMGHRVVLGTAPSKMWHRWQLCTRAQQSSTIMGHQNHSCVRANVLCWPWWPASWWTPFRAVQHWPVGTRKAKIPSQCIWGVSQQWFYKNSQRTMWNLTLFDLLDLMDLPSRPCDATYIRRAEPALESRFIWAT